MSLEQEVLEVMKKAGDEGRLAGMTAGSGTVGTIGNADPDKRLAMIEHMLGGITEAIEMIARQIDESGSMA
jgi:hypothetical protein